MHAHAGSIDSMIEWRILLGAHALLTQTAQQAQKSGARPPGLGHRDGVPEDQTTN